MYDCPPPTLAFNERLLPFRMLAAAGNEVPVLMEHTPPFYLEEHWRKWLPAFPGVVVKSVDEGLRDDVPIVTAAAMESIPEVKHAIHPDIMYDVQLKSSILQVGVPCPRYVRKESYAFP